MSMFSGPHGDSHTTAAEECEHVAARYIDMAADVPTTEMRSALAAIATATALLAVSHRLADLAPPVPITSAAPAPPAPAPVASATPVPDTRAEYQW